MFGKKKKKSDGNKKGSEKPKKEKKEKAEESDESESDEPERRINWNFIIIVILAVGIGLALWIASHWQPFAPSTEQTQEVTIDTEVKEEAKEEKKIVEKEPKAPTKYYALRPVFTVGIQDAEGTPRYLQLDLSIRARSKKVIDLLETHRPLLRDHLLTLFSKVTYEELYANEGKERLRKKALKTVQSVLEEQTGVQGIEALYFTSFVLQ